MVDNKLIEKFFDSRCTFEEAETVVEHFNKYPKDLEHYLPEKEWERFKSKDRLLKKASERMLRQIQKETYKRPSHQKHITLSIAASVVICLSVLGVIFWKIHINQTSELANIKKELSKVNNANGFITIENQEKETHVINLEEGSIIELSPESTIRYPRSFKNKEKRDIYLKGEALFKVAKDPNKPFTVFAGGLSTTALGTSFSIQSGSEHKKITVKLFTGKVVVKAVSEKIKGKMTDIYLTPGHGFELDPVSLTTSIHKLSDPSINNSSNQKGEEKPGSIIINGNIVEFKGVPLPEVFNRLSSIYKIKITYSHDDFSKTYFTGEINTTKPLENTLNTLAILNNLKILKVQQGYSIKND